MREPLTPAELRERVGLTQEQVARAIGRSVSTVSKWEQFVYQPRLTLSEVKIMLEIYQCDLNTLIRVFDRIDPELD